MFDAPPLALPRRLLGQSTIGDGEQVVRMGLEVRQLNLGSGRGQRFGKLEFRVLPVFTSESVLALLDEGLALGRSAATRVSAKRRSRSSRPRAARSWFRASFTSKAAPTETRVTTMSAAAPAWVQVR